jgi:hypothetical protein
MYLQDGAHEDRRAATPDASFDKVTGDIVPEDILYTPLDILKAPMAHHGVAKARPIAPFGACDWFKRLFLD